MRGLHTIDFTAGTATRISLTQYPSHRWVRLNTEAHIATAQPNDLAPTRVAVAVAGTGQLVEEQKQIRKKKERKKESYDLTMNTIHQAQAEK